jgi:endonuclease/exonuclease/phosphatase family metal-dependent hydrolase
VLRPQLLRLRADVLCLQEVHGQEVAAGRDLVVLKELLEDTPYGGFHLKHTRTTAGQPYDVRNLVIVSRFAFDGTPRQIMHDLTAKPRYKRLTAEPPDADAKEIGWERPVYYAKLTLGGGRTLHLMNLHMKSKLAVDIPGQKIDTYTWKTASGWAEGSFLAGLKRMGQALEVRRLVDEIFDDEGNDALIAICGDFNSDAEDVPLAAICGPVEETGNKDLAPRVLVPCENSVPESSRYSLFHLGKGEMLDHIVASRALLAFYRGTEIHNELLPDESGSFRTDVKFPDSDHAPVVAEFVLPG